MAESVEKSSRHMLVLYLLIFLVIVVATGVSWYFYTQYQTAQVMLKNSTGVALQKDAALIEKVGKLIELPHETPTLAEVSDKHKLQGQVFFTHAENGDRVLIFAQAKKAILYRPATNKIIEVGPVNIADTKGTPDATQSGTLIPSSAITSTIALYNGTTTIGLTSVAEKQLTEKYPGITVVVKDIAQKRSYTKTVVIDLSGKQKDAALALAKLVEGEVAPLPEGETAPDPKDTNGKTAEILIILGKNFIK